MSTSESLRDMLQRWRRGDQTAAAEIYARYQERVERFAELRVGAHLKRRFDADDITVLALKSVLRLTAEKTRTLDHKKSLWGFVAAIADKKIRKQVEFHYAAIRDVRREQEVGSGSAGVLPELQAGGLTPQEFAVMAYALEEILSRLNAADHTIFLLWLDGYSCSEIGEKVGCARYTVLRKTKEFKKLLCPIGEDDSGQ